MYEYGGLKQLRIIKPVYEIGVVVGAYSGSSLQFVKEPHDSSFEFFISNESDIPS